MPNHRSLGFFALLSLWSAACGGQTGQQTGALTCGPDGGRDLRALLYMPNLSQPGAQHKLTFVLVSSDPGPPIKGNNTWVVRVLDSANQPVAGATLTITPYMPDHGHGTPIVVTPTETSPGTYTLSPVNLFMSGLWQVTIDASTAAGVSDSGVFSFCIEG
jgi:hypothetical protein